MYCKILPWNMKERGFQFQKGINGIERDVQKTAFCPGGFYDINATLKHLYNGNVLWEVEPVGEVHEVELTVGCPLSEVYQEHREFRAKSIVLKNPRPLHLVDTWKWLADLGADIRMSDDLPLLWAVEQGFIPVIKYLLSKGADINADNERIGDIINSALLLALKKQDADTAKLLLRRGASANVLHEFLIDQACD